jgi:uncharacterized protein YfaT (DUF1175 family)
MAKIAENSDHINDQLGAFLVHFELVQFKNVCPNEQSEIFLTERGKLVLYINQPNDHKIHIYTTLLYLKYHTAIKKSKINILSPSKIYKKSYTIR